VLQVVQIGAVGASAATATPARVRGAWVENRHTTDASRSRAPRTASYRGNLRPNDCAERVRRIAALAMRRRRRAVPKDGWRRTVGMFAGNPIMREISEEGRRLREAEPPAE